MIVDNGYLNWPTTVPLLKTSCSTFNICFAQWLEFIRKDIECTLGILKGHFWILKTGIQLMGQESADNMFLTCCKLHNWLLNEGGLFKDWENGVQSNWEGPLGFHDIQDDEHHTPDVVWRLMSWTALRSYDVPGMGYGSDMRNQGDVTLAEHSMQGMPISLTTHERMGTNNYT